MDMISKNLFRGAGVLVAAQVFLTFGLDHESVLDKAFQAAKYGLMAVPVLAAAAFLTTENGLRAAGYTILLWAGAGTAGFFGAVYGDPQANQFAAEYIPGSYELGLDFGVANLAAVLTLGLTMWLWGLKNEPAPATFHGVGRR